MLMEHPDLDIEVDRIPGRDELRYDRIAVPSDETFQLPDEKEWVYFAEHVDGYVNMFRTPASSELSPDAHSFEVTMHDGLTRIVKGAYGTQPEEWSRESLPEAMEVAMYTDGRKGAKLSAMLRLDMARDLVDQIGGYSIEFERNNYHIARPEQGG